MFHVKQLGPETSETEVFGADECDNDFSADEDYCVDEQEPDDGDLF